MRKIPTRTRTLIFPLPAHFTTIKHFPSSARNTAAYRNHGLLIRSAIALGLASNRAHLATTRLPPAAHNVQARQSGVERRTATGSPRCFVLAADVALAATIHCLAKAALSGFGQAGRRFRTAGFGAREGTGVAGWRAGGSLSAG